MIIVNSIGTNQILAKNDKGQWYKVNDKSVNVGDRVSSKVCTKLNKSVSKLYNAVDELLNTLESNPIFTEDN